MRSGMPPRHDLIRNRQKSSNSNQLVEKNVLTSFRGYSMSSKQPDPGGKVKVFAVFVLVLAAVLVPAQADTWSVSSAMRP
jgi:hypothetical protein